MPSLPPPPHEQPPLTAGDIPLGDVIRGQVEGLLSRLSGEPVEGLHPVMMREVERSLLQTVLTHTNGHKEQAARILGLHRNTLRLRLAALGLGERATRRRRNARS